MRKYIQHQKKLFNVLRVAMSSISNPMRIEYISGAYKFNSDLTKKYGYITLENSFKVSSEKLTKGDELFSHENLQKSLMHESTSDLMRSFGVLGISKIEFIVENSNKLLKLSKTLFGNTISDAIVRNTIFKQFMGGETEDDVKILIDQLQTKNTGSIIDYAVESDINDDFVGENYSLDTNNKTISFIRDGQVIHTQQLCNESMDSFKVENDKYKNHIFAFLNSINIAAQQQNMAGIIAIKVSSICDPIHLNKINTYINNIQSVFNQFTDDEELIDFDGFTKDESLSCDEHILRKYFQEAKQDSQTEKLNYYQWMEFLNPKKDLQQLGLNLKILEPVLTHELNLIRARLNFICEHGKKHNVKVLVDAEQTYYQDLIHSITMELVRKFNTQQCIVYNTYQAYLKETLRKYLDDLHHASHSKTPFILGAKLVRGAYLERERELAHYFGTESPVCDNYNDTNLSFLRCLVAMVDSIHNNYGAGVIATHNVDSIKYTIDLMENKNIRLNDDRVVFAQLYGMCSFVSNILAENKVHIYKYLPYGPIDYVMPYMLRRINENKSVLARLGLETAIIKNELVKRTKNTLSTKPSP